MHLSLHSHGRSLPVDVRDEATRLRSEFGEAMARQQAAAADLERIADAITELARMAPPALPEKPPVAERPRPADQAAETAESCDPTGLCAEVTSEGIMLRWRCQPGAEFAIWRRIEPAEPGHPNETRRLATTAQTSFLDREIPPGAASVSYTVQRTTDGANCGSTHTTVRLLDLASAA